MPRQLAKLAITALKSMQRGSWTLPVAGMLLATQVHDMGTVQSLHLHQKEKVLEVGFDNGTTRRFSAELLRCLSPSADNAASPRRGGTLTQAAPALNPISKAKVVAGRRYVGIMSLEPVGNYAVRIRYDDLHDGIYPFDFFRDLGLNRLSWAKRYIRLLRQAGLSRDPRRGSTRQRAGS